MSAVLVGGHCALLHPPENGKTWCESRVLQALPGVLPGASPLHAAPPSPHLLLARQPRHVQDAHGMHSMGEEPGSAGLPPPRQQVKRQKRPGRPGEQRGGQLRAGGMT